jgi:hypothetical protein
MVLAVTDGPGGVDILINAAARPNTGTVEGIDASDDPEPSEQINVKALGTGTTRRAAAARTRPARRALGVPARPRHHRGRDPAARRRAHPGRELVRLARQHGYRRDELIQIIESLP